RKINTYRHFYFLLQDIRFPPAYSVNKENIEKAKNTVSGFEPNGGTNINDALKVALHLIEDERKSNKGSDKLQPLIIFLTDGEPTVGVYSTDQIVAEISEFNQGRRKSVLFSLSFGEAADKKFLQKLALHNSGFSKHIYEGADASLQLQGFYKQISSPLLANVTFKYVPTVTGVTKTIFPVLFNGSEIVVAGRYEQPPSESPENGKDDVIALDVVAFCGTGLINLKPIYERPVTGLQRIWAYLTVKQLLEEKEISKNPDELKKKALAIALQHSFVTPVSSLVVVKPNETRSVDAESTQNSRKFHPFHFCIGFDKDFSNTFFKCTNDQLRCLLVINRLNTGIRIKLIRKVRYT
ncbi:inter-alpha-trypsin inhibitor heavy chain H4-like, partial [Agrilus planipennis]|uniref:Inter-alpha-trypsin inhibitor heavy chain H4-like n=1 Tax=Agrilus planipennis TaxID=224129 RepID=A0A7F5RE94_AGRPL